VKRLYAVCALLLGAFAPASAQTPAVPKIQVLIIAGQNVHDWRATTPVLRTLLEETGRFEVRVTEEFRGAGPETLAPYDVVLLNFQDRRPADRWGERAQNALLDFVRGGKGVVVYHFATAAFDGWGEYDKLAAGTWRPGNGHHSARHDFKVDIKDREHPITRGLAASYPQPTDELYANLRWTPEGTYHVLATSWDDHSLYTPNQKQPVSGPGLNHPMLWTVDYGKGRVFADALGHDPAAMKSEIFITTLRRGTEWAATGKVTIAP
jgi:uncharacterized protein